ncbi:hypothetical protein [Nocardioides sp. W7]|uniref:hypothetical protein n=1 Tax=Nocardioides sp. W7 TaxID=2931390 RepID=UPI001FD5437C|nr:hypothetical protein [Nocardioides sp. W7]
MTQNQPGDQRPQDETSPLAAQPAAAGSTATAEAGPPPPPPPAPPAYEAAASPPRPGPLRRVPRTAWLSAAAVLVVVGIGLGGFLVGRATAPDNDFRPPFDRGERPDFPGDRGGPGGQGRPGGPGGQLPGQQGQAPAQPGGGTDGSTEDGTDGSTQENSADTTAWYVVAQTA